MPAPYVSEFEVCTRRLFAKSAMPNVRAVVISCDVESARANDQLPSRMMRHDSMSNVASPIASRD